MSVCLSVTRVLCVKTAERIMRTFWRTLVNTSSLRDDRRGKAGVWRKTELTAAAADKSHDARCIIDHVNDVSRATAALPINASSLLLC